MLYTHHSRDIAGSANAVVLIKAHHQLRATIWLVIYAYGTSGRWGGGGGGGGGGGHDYNTQQLWYLGACPTKKSKIASEVIFWTNSYLPLLR